MVREVREVAASRQGSRWRSHDWLNHACLALIARACETAMATRFTFAPLASHQPVDSMHLFHTKSLNTASDLRLRRRQSLRGEPGGGRKDSGLRRKKGANDCVGYAVFVRGENAASPLIITLPQMARQTLRGIS